MSITTLPAQSVEMKAIDSVIYASKQQQLPQTYFATLYTTMLTQIGIAEKNGHFTDTALIEYIQLHFNSYFLKTLEAFKTGDSIPYCWKLALDTSTCKNCSYVQWLALGTNAHINHDLYFILLSYFKANGTEGHNAAKTQSEFMAISNNETDRTIDNFISTDPNIGRWDAFLIRLGKGTVKGQMKSSLKTTWENAMDAAQHPEKEAAVTKRQLDYVHYTAQSFITPRFPMRQGLSILSSLDLLPFEAKLEMLKSHENLVSNK